MRCPLDCGQYAVTGESVARTAPAGSCRAGATEAGAPSLDREPHGRTGCRPTVEGKFTSTMRAVPNISMTAGAGDIFPGHHQAKGDERDEDVPFAPFLESIGDGTDPAAPFFTLRASGLNVVRSRRSCHFGLSEPATVCSAILDFAPMAVFLAVQDVSCGTRA